MDLFSPAIFEMVMLLCFGCSWPFAIAKTIRTHSVDGISIWFISMVFIGYLAGILYKLIVHFDGVIWLYATNGSMVLAQIFLYLKYTYTEADYGACPTLCVIPDPDADHDQSYGTRKRDAYGSEYRSLNRLPLPSRKRAS